MNSLEWRIKKLEDKLLASRAGSTYVDRVYGHNSSQNDVISQFETVAKAYKNFTDLSGQDYAKFNQLYKKYRTLLTSLDSSSENSIATKQQLVLAYEQDLVKHMQDTKELTEKADKILNPERWPDTREFNKRLEKLLEINREQYLQSTQVDKETEELINIYNDIINTFKSNMKCWNQKLEAYEDVEKKMDDDE